MKFYRWMLVLALTFAGVHVAAAKDAMVAGTVVDQDGKPVGGVVVSGAYPGNKITVSVITDPAGAFHLPLQQDAQVIAWKKGYRNVAPQKVADGKPAKFELKMTTIPALPASQLSTADIFPNLPDDTGKKEFTSQCYACHGYSRMLARPRSQDEWAQTVKRMSSILYDSGLPTNTHDQSMIVDYLTKYLGEGSTLPQEIGEKVKKDPSTVPVGHDIVLTEYEIPTPNALSHTSVPDKRGHVYFSEYFGRKVGRLDVATGEIKEWPVDTPGTGAHGITVGPDGTVWFTALPLAIGRIDAETGKKEEFRVPLGKSPSGPSPHTIIVAKSGLIYYSELTNHSISRYNPTTKEFKRYELKDNETAYGILEKEPDIFWFGLVSPGGVGRLDAKTGEIKRWYLSTPGTATQRMRFDAKGRVWLGEFRGNKMAMFDPETEKFAEYELPHMCSPYSIHIDPKQDVWTGCYDRDSFMKYNPTTKEFVEYPLPGVSDIMRDIWPDETGRIWFSEWARNKVASIQVVP